MKLLRAAMVQMNSGCDPAANLARVAALLDSAGPVDLVALPEVVACRGSDDDYRATAQPLDGPIVAALARLARRASAWVLIGSVAERSGDRVFNTAVLLNRAGEVAASYRKMHLFEAHLEDGRHIREADAFSAGDSPAVVDVEGWSTVLTVCYDLRFPELFRLGSQAGAHLFLVPSNFTQRTGQDHWEILVRARAIENQCFVVAPDQCGANAATGVVSYGNSLAAGPWGEVLCRLKDEESVGVVELDPARLTGIRQRIPVLRHRRL